MVYVWGLSVRVSPAGGQPATHPARVALEELDLLIELDVVGSQVVQLALQGVHRVLHHAVLLHGGSKGAVSSEAGGRPGSNWVGGRKGLAGANPAGVQSPLSN